MVENEFNNMGVPKGIHPLRTSQGHFSILICDDDQIVRMILDGFISKALRDGIPLKKIKIIDCSDGRQTLDKLRDLDVDLCFLDIGLPDYTGTEVVKKFQDESGKDSSCTSFIAMSASPIEKVLTQGATFRSLTLERGNSTKAKPSVYADMPQEKGFLFQAFLEKPFNDKAILDILTVHGVIA